MRVLAALGSCSLSSSGEGSTDASAGRRDVRTAAGVLAALAAEHELVLAHWAESSVGQMLGTALRNALPDRDLVTVMTSVIVGADGADESLEPSAVAELPSLRLLIDSGALVVCAGARDRPIALDEAGAMREVEARLDEDLTAALLARRLDADLLVILSGAGAPRQSQGAERAARRFAEATGRRAAIGPLREAVEIARGSAGTQISARSA